MSSEDHVWSWGWVVSDPLCVSFLGIIFLYFVLLEGIYGATVGKQLLRLRVVDTDGSVPGVGKAIVRNLLRIVDGLPALSILGIVLIATSPDRARFGDRVAGTRVVIVS